MIISGNSSINNVYYSGYTISKIYACGGSLVWSGDIPTIYRWVKTDTAECLEETPSPTNIMFKAKYINGYVYSVVCNGDTTLSSSYSQPNELMTEATIGNCITAIGNNPDKPFYQCYSLSSVTIPNSVTSIGVGAFEYCYSLTNITIPTGVTSIGDSAFLDCKSLTSITIPSGVTNISDSVFNGCSGLTNVTLSNSLTSIGNFSFSNCDSLSSIIIPSGVTSIGKSAFYTCKSLSSVTIPSGVTSIGDNAFRGGYNLSSITCLAITPPTLGFNVFDYTNNCPIYVPSASLTAYQTAWSQYADRIQAITN